MMKTKLLYVLVSSPEDNYLEMAHISITSAKYYMPDCHVVLLVDDQTDRLMDDNRRKILKNVDEYIVVPLENNVSAHVRSRLIKCGARQYVKGDFFYFYTDTIIVKPLYEIDQVEASIAAVRDSHLDFSDSSNKYFFQFYVDQCKVIGYTVEDDADLFNCGLFYVKDDDIAYRFYEMWLDEWKKGNDKGMPKDQPSAMKVNSQMGYVIQKLDDRWNVQIIRGIRYMKDAKICHYLVSDYNNITNPYILNSASAFSSLKEDLDNVNSDFYMKLIKDPFTGIGELTMLISGEEIFFRKTRLYTVLRYWYYHKRSRYKRIQSIMTALFDITRL